MMKNDLRKYSRQTISRLVIGGLLITFVIGLGLIWLIYGSGAAAMGFICLLTGMVPVVLVVFTLWIIDVIVKKNRVDN